MIAYQTQKTRELQAREAARIMAGTSPRATLTKAIDKAITDGAPVFVNQPKETPLQFRKRAGDLTTS
jgi:hypothetical protein